MSFSPDGKYFFTGGCLEREHFGTAVAGDIKLWSLDTGECIRSFKAHDREVAAVKFLLDGKRVISCGNDHHLKLWPVDWSLLKLDGEEILKNAEKQAGLQLDRFNLVPEIK